MKITGWQIDGYGVFSGYRQERLGEGLNVFCGPNEAGKSTLLAFLRGVLFGFPGARQGGPLPALNGGAHGGKIFLENADGRWTVARRPGRNNFSLTRPDGTPGSEEELTELLHQFDEKSYRAVFGFDLDDLAEIGLLGEDRIRDKLFSAGISGAGSSAKEAEASLQKEMESILKPRAGGLINEGLARVRALEAELKTLEEYADGYASKTLEAEALLSEIEKLAADKASLSREKSQLELLIALWPPFVNKKAAENKLAMLGAPVSFPKNGLETLAALEKDISNAKTAVAKAENDLEKIRFRLDAIDADPVLAGAEAALRPFYAQVPAHRERIKNALAAGEEAAKTKREAEEALGRLGESWDEEKLSRLALGLESEAKTRDWVEKLKVAQEASREAERNFDEARSKLEKLPKLSISVEDPAEAAVRLADLKEHSRLARERLTAPLPPYVIISAILGLALAGGAAFSPFAAIPAAALLIAAAALYCKSSRDKKLFSARVAASAASFGLPPLPSAGEIERVESELRRLGEVKSCQEDLAAASAALARTKENLRNLSEEWKAEVSALGGIDHPPATFIELLREGERAKSALANAKLKAGYARARSEEIEAWEEKAAGALSALPGHIPAIEGGEKLLGALELAYEKCSLAQKSLEEKNRLQSSFEEKALELKGLTDALEGARAGLDGLLSSAKAADPRAFQDKAALYAEGLTLKNTISLCEGQLRESLGEGESAGDILTALSQGQKVQWEAALAETKSNMRALEETLGEAQKRSGLLSGQMESIESSGEMAELLQKIESLKAEILERARRWRTLSLAKTLIRSSLDKYTRERQPAVLEKASIILEELTSGRFTRVLPSQEEEKSDLVAVKFDGERLLTRQLSRGTKEELYLSLRLALAHDFGEKTGPLPLILDDVFVNFDPARATAALLAVASCAKGGQAILFTCHPETVERIKKAGIEACFIELPPPPLPSDLSPALAP